MEITEFARLGGKARWKGKTKKERSDAMKKVRASSKKLSTPKTVDVQAHKV